MDTMMQTVQSNESFPAIHLEDDATQQTLNSEEVDSLVMARL